MGISTPGESVSLERKIESSIFLCIPRDLNILGKSCTTFVIVKIVRNLSRGRSPCQKVNHVKSGVIYFSAFIFSYDTIHVFGTIHTWNRDLTHNPTKTRTCARENSIVAVVCRIADGEERWFKGGRLKERRYDKIEFF